MQGEPPSRGDGPEQRIRESRRERRRRRRRARREENRGSSTDWLGDACEAACDSQSCDGCGRLFRRRSGSSGGDGCSCDGPCDLSLLRLSTLLLVAAAVTPPRGAGGLVRALLRGYQRWLTRYTPACPSRPNCSAYALAAVEASGVRAGLRAAAARVEACGTPAPPPR